MNLSSNADEYSQLPKIIKKKVEPFRINYGIYVHHSLVFAVSELSLLCKIEHEIRDRIPPKTQIT